MLAHIETASVLFVYRTSPNDQRAVRDFVVELYVPLTLREPRAQYADGTPAGFDRHISSEAMRGIVRALQDLDFFGKAHRRHSEAVPNPTSPPPPESTSTTAVYWPTSHPSGAVEIQVRVIAGQWHHYFTCSYELNHETRDMLQRIAKQAPDDARRDIEAGTLGKMR